MVKAPVEASNPVDSPRKAKVRRFVTGALAKSGFRIEKLEDTKTFVPGRSTATVDFQHHVAKTPGMITLRRSMYLYWLSYAGIPGDVIEIGSWQGRSTIALAQGCADSDNGVVHAVDTFKGNPGTEHQYVVGAEDLSDLEPNLHRNIAAAGLTERVKVYSMRSADAADLINPERVRLIYIDAEHSYAAVKDELARYADKLSSGGLLTFDDYSTAFPGVAQAIHEHLDTHPDRYVTPVQDRNFLVLKRREG